MKNKKIFISLSVLLTLVVLLTILPFNIFGYESMKIFDYQPSKYTELAEKPFFYSIGKTLRYGKTISEKTPVLFKGNSGLHVAYPSPDNKKAIVLSENKLYLIRPVKPLKLLLDNIDNYRASSVKTGEYFFLGASLQWDKSSNCFYIVRYTKKENELKTMNSHDTALIKINIDKPAKREIVINNFSSRSYYFVGANTVCFNYAPGNGDLIWKCQYQGKKIKVKSQTKDKVILANGITLSEKPFVSTRIGHGIIHLTENGFFLKRLDENTSGFFSKAFGEKPIFKIRTSHNIKGHFIDGVDEVYSDVLPGGRYVLLNVYYENFEGQLLIDGVTGKYKELPSKTRVYTTLNSFNYKHFHFGNNSINNPEFVPVKKLRY